MTPRTLSRAERRATCIHEAGHAVAFALGGTPVYRLVVAPEGASAWRTECRNGLRACSDLWGLCEKAELVLPRHFMRWMMNEGCLHPDGRGFETLLETPEGQAQIEGFSAALQQQIQTHVVALVAGPVAEDLHQLGQVALSSPMAQHDLDRAASLARLLPQPKGFDRARPLAEAALRRPDIWNAVLQVANALEAAGDLSQDLACLLPPAEPGWPGLLEP